MHSDVEKLDMWRSLRRDCGLAANYTDKRQLTLIEYHLESALAQVRYLRNEQIEAASGACEVE